MGVPVFIPHRALTLLCPVLAPAVDNCVGYQRDRHDAGPKVLLAAMRRGFLCHLPVPLGYGAADRCFAE